MFTVVDRCADIRLIDRGFNSRIVSVGKGWRTRISTVTFYLWEYKEGLSDETKNRGPVYLSIYARASKRSHTGGQ
jgi:hypothetical protein